jgi:uncharacterized protein YndB with AHSA1/START domain
MKRLPTRPDSQHVVEIEKRIASPPEIVFLFFTDPERYRLWQGVEAELDPRPGGIFRVVMTGKSGVVASGVYLEVDPPRRVSFTWGWEAPLPLAEGQAEVPPGSSTVEIDLVADGDGTLVRLRHGHLPSLPSFQFHSLGWSFSLERLAAVSVGADPGPNPFPDF